MMELYCDKRKVLEDEDVVNASNLLNTVPQ